MNKKKHLALVIAATLILSACLKDDPITTGVGKGTFIDQGLIPAEVEADYAIFQAAIYHEGHVFVATSDGIWKNKLSTKEWSRAGLEGKHITAIFKHPTITNKFFAGVESDNSATSKTLFISTDGGVSWQAANSPVFDDLEKRYENYFCFAVRPDHPNHIYANLEGGAMIAVSTDGGLNWLRQNNATENYFGYPCNIVFLPNNPNSVYQGSENPLDDAWLGKYDINSGNPILLENFSKVIDNASGSCFQWPLCLSFFFSCFNSNFCWMSSCCFILASFFLSEFSSECCCFNKAWAFVNTYFDMPSC
jgi:hypothetical protein